MFAARRNLIIMIGLDAALVVVSIYLSFFIRFDFQIPGEQWIIVNRIWPFMLAVKLGFYWFFGLYRGMWRYTSLLELANVLKAVVLSTLVIVTGALMIHRFMGYPRSVFLIDAVLTFLAVSGVRVAVRLHYSQGAGIGLLPRFSRLTRGDHKRLLIIGAGDAGEKVVREIQASPDLRVQPVGFLDDQPERKGKLIHGVPVLGPIEGLALMPKAFDEILIAMPTAKSEEMRQMVSLCERTSKPFRIVPAMGELIGGRVSLKAVRNVRVEDLLGRTELFLDQDAIALYLRGKRVLVTGAGGSIGSELVRQIGQFKPESLGLLDISEHNLFKVDLEFRQRFPELTGIPYLADIRDVNSLGRVFKEFAPQVVFHAAAYKHVPMQEIFPWEAVTNNVLGTMNLVEASQAATVERFVLVSTDKAVRPTNVMGATKRVAEMFVECMDRTGQTRFMAVRFGNVVGSSGSAIPLFREQITRGGPVTVTHPEVCRYFMSVGEAAQLILQAGSIGEGGEIFILEMGRPIKILDLVKDMIRLHGLEPERDIAIEFIGLRPGEKLYEELITEGEGIVPSGVEKILVLKGNSCNTDWFRSRISELTAMAESFDELAIRDKLKEMVPEYGPEK